MVQIHVCRCRKRESFKISLLNHVYSKTTNVKLYHVTKFLPLLSNYHLLYVKKLRSLMPVRLIRFILSVFTRSTLRQFQLESRVCLFSWDDCHTHEKWKTNPMQNLGKGVCLFWWTECRDQLQWRIQVRGPAPPLFLDQTEARRKLFPDHPPPLSKGLDDHPPPPPLSQGLDPALTKLVFEGQLQKIPNRGDM